MVSEISEHSIIQRLDKEAKMKFVLFSQRELQVYIYSYTKTESEEGVSSPNLYILDLGEELSSLI